MAKYLINSTDIEIEEVSGTQNLKFNFASGNSVEQMIGDLSNLNTTDQSSVVNAINEVNGELTNLNTYSTTEINTGKVWINNKPIYRIVLSGTTPSAEGSLSETIPNATELINLYGYVNSSSSNRISLNSYKTATDFCRVIGETFNPLTFTFSSGAVYYSKPYYMVVEYTK